MEPKYIKYVANYLRKSRGDSDSDLEKHKKVIRELCESNEWKYIEYCEIGSGDSIADREVFRKLLDDIESELFDAVCVIDIDRLGRGDMGDQDRVKKIFIKSDTYVVTPQQIYNLKNDDDEFVVDMRSFIARREYKQIVKRLSQGKKIGAKMGMWTNGTPPFPYEYERYGEKFHSKGLVVNDEKLLIYREMVDGILKDAITPSQIAWNLNRREIPAPRGGAWHGVTVERILKSEVHLGKVISNKTKGDGHVKKTNKHPVVSLTKDKWVVVDNCHEAVKTQDEHNKILLFLSRITKAPKRKPIVIKPLSGLIKCGICGRTMTLNVRADRGYRESLKPCWYRDKYGNKCGNEGLNTDILYKKIGEAILTRKNSLILYIQNQSLIGTNSVLESQKEHLLTEIKKKENSLEKILDAFEAGIYTLAKFDERNRKAELAISKLKDELNIINIELGKNCEQSIEDQISRIDYFLDNFESEFSDAEKNKLYKSVIDRIIWIKQGNDIDINIIFKGGDAL